MYVKRFDVDRLARSDRRPRPGRDADLQQLGSDHQHDGDQPRGGCRRFDLDGLNTLDSVIAIGDELHGSAERRELGDDAAGG